MNPYLSQRVQELADGTRTAEQIAEETHSSVATIRRYARAHRRRLLTEREAEYKKLVEQTVAAYLLNKSVYDTAAELNVRPETVYNRLRSAGYNPPRPNKIMQSPVRTRITYLRNQQYTAEEIAEEIGKSRTYVKRVLAGEGEVVCVWLPQILIERLEMLPALGSDNQQRVYNIVDEYLQEL